MCHVASLGKLAGRAEAGGLNRSYVDKTEHHHQKRWGGTTEDAASPAGANMRPGVP